MREARDTTVEAVARAIRESSGWPTPWDDLVPSYQDTYRTQARAAIKALVDIGMEIRDVRPIGKQVHEWLSNENNREQIRKMMERLDDNFRMNSGAVPGPLPPLASGGGW